METAARVLVTGHGRPLSLVTVWPTGPQRTFRTYLHLDEDPGLVLLEMIRYCRGYVDCQICHFCVALNCFTIGSSNLTEGRFPVMSAGGCGINRRSETSKIPIAHILTTRVRGLSVSQACSFQIRGLMRASRRRELATAWLDQKSQIRFPGTDVSSTRTASCF
jgi:hypothetical protein